MTMAFDYKKEYKEFYLPKNKPTIINIPSMNFIAIRGKGNPNEEDGRYRQGLGKLYAVAYTLKMSYKGDHKIKGFFEYVVPPLEGFWWQEGSTDIDYQKKEQFSFISLIRIPDFITKEDFHWAIAEATRKKKLDLQEVEFFTYEEGLCVQSMHLGSYDDEPKTVAEMDKFALENGYEIDISSTRFHHEIYLSDPRKCEPNKLKTVIRHPIRKSQS